MHFHIYHIVQLVALFYSALGYKMMLSTDKTFPVACSWCLWTLLSLCYGLEFRYHNSAEVEKYLREVTRNYPSFTYRYNIGRSVEGKGFVSMKQYVILTWMTKSN